MDFDPWADPRDDPTYLPRVVTLADVGLAYHLVRGHLRSGRWLRLAPGIYCTQPPATQLDRVRAALAHGGRLAVVSGTAALGQYGFHCVRTVTRELVLVPTSGGARSVGRIVVRRTSRLPAAELRPGPAVAPPARAAVDHARTLRRLDDVRAVVAEAVQRSFCVPSELWDEVEQGARNGRALVRQAVLEVIDGARSAPEAKAAGLLRHAGLGGFEQNVAVVVDGRRFCVDFLWRELRAILEIDSVEHHAHLRGWRNTLERHLILESGGFSVVHVPPSALQDAAAFTGHIARWLTSRAHILR